MQEENYWTNALKQRITRRGLLRTGAIAGLGLTSFDSAGCTEIQQPKSTVTPDSDASLAAASPTAARPMYGGSLRIVGQDPLGFDPHDAVSYRTHQALSYLYSRVLEFPQGPTADPVDYTPGPGLAENWEQPDEVTYVFSLRRGVKWHNKPPVNGRPLDGVDIKYTIERMLASSFPYKDLFGKVAKIEVPAKDKVKFTLKEPFVPFLSNLANHYAWILAKEMVDKGKDFKKPEGAVGTGPFTLQSYEPNVKCVFKRNPEFWLQGLPYVDEVQWLVMPDPSTQLSSLRIGNLEIADVQTPEVEAVKKINPELQWLNWTGVGGNAFFYRVDKKPYDDVRVRRAINLAIDRKAWLDAFSMGKGSIDNGPPLPAGYKEWKLPLDELGSGAQWWKFDPVQARKLLAEAGYPNGFKATLDTTAGYGPDVVDEAETIKVYLSKVGIDVSINVKGYTDWLVTGQAGIYDEMAYGAMPPCIEIDEWTYGMFHSNGTANKGHIGDRTLNLLLEKQRKQFDKAERKKTIDEIQRYVADQCYYFFAPAGEINTAWQPYVRNYRPHSGYDQGASYRQVWLDKSNRR